MSREHILEIGVVQAGVNDGYWEDVAVSEIQAELVKARLDELDKITRYYAPTGSALAGYLKRKKKKLKSVLAELEATDEQS